MLFQDVMYPVIGCGVFLCGVTLSCLRTMADGAEGKSPRKRLPRAAFLALKSWSKRMHRRSCSRVDSAFECSSEDTHCKADERSHSTESECLSSESFEVNISPEKLSKGTVPLLCRHASERCAYPVVHICPSGTSKAGRRSYLS